MPNDPKGSPKRGWRVGGADEAAPAWRKEVAATTTPARRTLSRRAKFGVGFTLLLGAVGLFIWVATFFRPPSPAYLVLVGADYADNLAVAHNLDGWQGLKALGTFADAGRRWFFWSERPLFGGTGTPSTFDMKSRGQWANGLKDVKEDMLLICVAAHGGVDGQGVYLIPNDFNPYAGDEKAVQAGKLRLGDLLNQLPLDKKKVLLLLDANVLTAHWPLGMLHNDFPRQLRQELDERAKDGRAANLLVLSACDVGQRSWASDVWRRTVFGHYVLEGLAGAADAGGDGSVSAADLIEYVRKQVESWARANRDEVQTPVSWHSDTVKPENIVLAVVSGSKPAPGPDGETLHKEQLAAKEQLRRAWEEHDTLHARVPHPGVYSPHLWRQYRDTLLRFEQLVRAGAPAKTVDGLSTRLGTSAAEIAKARQPRLDARQGLLTAALPMPLVLGHAASGKDGRFDDLWKAEERKAEAVWRKLQGDLASKGAADAAALQELEAVGQLLEKAAKSLRPEDRTRLRNLLQLVQQDGATRPVEAHTFLILDQRRNRANLPDEDLARAVRLGRLAERVALAADDAATADAGDADTGPQVYAPSSERVWPWIAASITEADKARRDALDWLVGGTEEHAKTARGHLALAEKRYQDAAGQAAVVREAYGLRDEVLAELPYYTQWLARRRLTPDPRRRAGEEKRFALLLATAEQLWKNVHLLSARLDSPDPATLFAPPAQDKLEPKPLSLQDRLEPIKVDFRQLREAFDAYCQVDAGGSALQEVWHQIDAALAVPFHDPQKRLDRMKLLDAQTAVAKKLQEEHLAGSASGSSAARASRDVEGAAREAAERQGRLALASLGPVWLAEQEKTGAGIAYDTLGRLIVGHGKTSWWGPLGEAGSQVGKLWRGLPRTVRELTAGTQDAEKWLNERKGEDHLKGLAADLGRAEAWCRQLDGAAAGGVPRDPVGEHRRLRLHNLFLARAERAWLDHWWCTAEDHQKLKQPYFAGAVETYLKAARELIVQGVDDNRLQDLRQAGAAALKNRLPTTKVECARPGAARLAWTTERKMLLKWELTAKGVPDGEAMFWLRTSPSLKAYDAAEKLDARTPRTLLKGAAEPLAYTLALGPDAVNPERQRSRQGDKPLEARADLLGVFRGQPIEAPTPIDIYREADTVVYQRPPEPWAGLAVQADPKLHLGTLTIVLDYSNSMNVPEGGKRGRYHDAVEVLEDVLRQIPLGTTLSVWAFSHKGAASPDGDLIQPPLVWNGDEHRNAVMGRIKRLEPSGVTPLVQAMIKAKQELVGKPGLKTLLVLTDGEDSEFKKGLSDGEREAAIAQELRRQFAHQEIEGERFLVSMVLFQNKNTESGKREIARARRQFESVIKGLPLPGNFSVAGDRKELAADLLEATRPRLRLLRNNEPVGKRDGFKVTFSDERGSYGWSRALEAGESRDGQLYLAEVQNVYQDVALHSGQRMVILLKPDPVRGIRFERGLIADLYGRKDLPPLDRGDYRLAVLQNRDLGGGGGEAVELLLSVESRKGVVVGRPGILRQPPPGFLWLEMTAGGKPVPGLRWGHEWNYQGPVWKIASDRWPSPDGRPLAPELRVWWQEDPQPEVARTVVHADPTRQFEEALRGEGTDLDGIKVTVESVEAETHKLGGRQDEVECLVVRLRHEPADRPVWVQLAGPEAIGAEYRFFAESGRVTAFFWRVPRAEAQKGFRLQLTSLPEFKRKAQLRVDEKDLKLSVPDVGRGPNPVNLER